ncbi:hypothetical protein ACFL2Q_09600, partial [Thermodesulfobacteriota bacterium]
IKKKGKTRKTKKERRDQSEAPFFAEVIQEPGRACVYGLSDSPLLIRARLQGVLEHVGCTSQPWNRKTFEISNGS